MKESFILHNSFYEPIKALKNEQLGKLLRAIFDYTTNGIITQDNDIIVPFMFIKNQIDLDAKKWENEREKRSLAGKKGMETRWHNKNNNVINDNNKNNNVKSVITKITDNVNVNVNVNDNVNNNKKNKQKKYFENDELNCLFLEYLDLRLKLKCKNTERAINLLLSKLNQYDDATKKEMINNSIMNSWKSVYEIKNSKKKEPSWLNQEIKKEEVELSEEELEWLKSIE